MADISAESIKKLIDAGITMAGPQVPPTVGNVPYALVPQGFALQSLEALLFNDHCAAPQRVKQKPVVYDADSFIYYFQLFADPNSRVFADEQKSSVTGIIDYHAAGEGTARWCQHSLTLALRASEEWTRWTSSNNRQFTQQAFAEFLEQNSIDITTPAPAHMMEVARDLSASTEVEFGSGVRMQDGQVRFKYTETTKANVGSGSLAVPEHFTISVPVFIGSEPVSLQALLRFRCKEGKLIFWYTLVRPEAAQRAAFLAIRNRISEGLDVTIINGSAAA